MPIPQHRWLELLVFLVSFLLITLLDRRERLQQTPAFYTLSAWLLRITYRPIRAYGFLAGYTLFLLLLLSFVVGAHPFAPEEFSQQLAADTFAQGRLSNPSHPLWTFFETIQVISQPFYASKFPPAQGMFMAFGQLIFGTPVVGVWLGYIGAVLAVYWLLTLCMPAVPALIGGWLVATHATFVLNWGLGYGGGGLSMLGGALMVGGMIALLRQPRGRHVTLMAVGLLLLWCNLPVEGVIFSIVPLGVLLYAIQQVQYWYGTRPLLRWIPGLLLMGASIVALPAYNHAVTGDILRMPSSYYTQQYRQTRHFLFQRARKEILYNRPEMKRFHKREAATFGYRKTIEGFVVGVFRKVLVFENFYLGLLFLVPFVLFLVGPWEATGRLAFWSVLIAFGTNLLSSTELPHQLAPATGALAVIVGQGLLFMWYASGRWRDWGPRFVLAVVLSTLPLAVLESIYLTRSANWKAGQQRQANEAFLTAKSGQHVVLVKYAPTHSISEEWVYNQANIDSQSVIWAVDKGARQNWALFRYYPNRTFWQLRPDENAGKLYRLRQPVSGDVAKR
ncbi:hypothetical protein HNV11_12495 [Spirosoma taeanense]|uniref:Glycosyltransferase RgtA/B/C/D-like domain-containing protein n=1 Tax=Spirosoma taeanense TaxID=2735870 RepID=A0A6M5Y6V8_9BACT|nr:hypothetical protein [Spirosoma taeanense]QJW90138.1 hypothetical protein HNV11_12495 [Spirosoma taeanense]